MDSFKRNWRRIPRPIRKTLVLIIGIFVISVGLLLLIFPGPGWLVIFAGLAVLATEFAIAEKARDWLINQFQQWWGKAKIEIKKKFKG